MTNLPSTKYCSRCDTHVPREGFSQRTYKNSRGETKIRWTFLCKPCSVSYQKEKGYHKKWRDKNIEKYREKNKTKHLRSNYGVDLDWFKNKLEEQGGLCAVCYSGFGPLGPRVDHCHSTGTVRELLCHFCNAALGMLREDVDIMSRMIEYKIKHSGGALLR